MKAVIRRLRRLEDQFKPANGSRQSLEWVVTRAERRLALDASTCVQILRECGFLPAGPFFRVVKLGKIPDGLTEEETERFLREKGAEICGPQNHRGPAGASAHPAPLQTS